MVNEEQIWRQSEAGALNALSFRLSGTIRPRPVEMAKAGKAAALQEVIAERAGLKNKTMALSDLLAVFRAA